MIIKFLILVALVASPTLCSSIKGYQQRSDDGLKGGRQFSSPIEQQRRLTEQQREVKGGFKGQTFEVVKTEQVKLDGPAYQQERLTEQKVDELKQEPLLQQEQLKEEKIEQFQQQKEELQQQRIEESAAKGLHTKYEAKPQLSRDELAKGQQRSEEFSKTRFEQKEQQKEEILSKTSSKREEAPATKIEQQKELPSPLPLQAQPALPKIEQQQDRTEQQKEEKFEQLQQQRNTEFDSQIELKEEQRRYEEPALVQPILPLTVVEDTREQRIEQSSIKGGVVAAAAPLGEAEPYSFSYQVDGSSRSESGDTKGVVRGQYTLQGADGSSRIVDYVADQNGFRASVNTNEFGTESKSPAGVALRTSQPLAEDITLRLEGKTREDLTSLPVASKTSPSSSSYTKENWSQTKGGSQESWPKKTQEQIQYQKLEQVPLAIPAAPAKGQRFEEQKFEEHSAVKSAELQQQPIRTDRGLKSAEQKSLDLQQNRLATFESATAHRNYKLSPASVAPVARKQLQQAPAVLVRQQQPIRSYQQPAVSRSYLRGERYPPVVAPSRPVLVEPAAGHVVVPPRVSFYSSPSQPATGPINFDDEQPNSFSELEQ